MKAVATRVGLFPVLVGGAIVSQRKRVVKEFLFSADKLRYGKPGIESLAESEKCPQALNPNAQASP